MARSKRSTALYEVISAARQYPHTTRIRQASWWTRARRWWNTPRPAAATGAPESARKESVDFPSPAAPVVESAVHAEQTMTASSPAPISRPVDFAVDPELRQIALRMSYGTAVMAGGALVAIVLMSIAVGRYMTRGSVPLLAQTTTDEVRKGPAHREVLELPRHVTVSGDASTATSPQHVTGTQTSASIPARPPIAPTEPTKRYIGYNYVIIQSYPPTEAKMATDAAAFLNSHAVTCTLEQDIKGWRNYVCVVGLDGFARQTSPECKAYIEHIKELSSEYGGKAGRGFKQFDPVVKKWDKQD
jgi:hypothetical protein